MSLYICPVCGDKFNHPDIARYAHETWPCCPNCGDPDFEAAARCTCCGEDYRDSDLIGGLCPECIEGEATAEDYRDFAHDPQVQECFAEWLAERYSETWKERRLKRYRKEGT